MVKNLLLPILGVTIFIIIVGLLSKNSLQGNSKKYFNFLKPNSTVKQIKVGSTTIKVEVADTPEKRTKGLSGRNSMDFNSGMLFVFENKGITPVFWMKDMLFPLDLIWIANGKIVKIDKNLPAPKNNTEDKELPTYKSNIPVDYVLEVNAGFTDKNNIKVGDSLDLTSIEK